MMECTSKSMKELFEDHESAEDEGESLVKTIDETLCSQGQMGQEDKMEQDNELCSRDEGGTWREPRQPERPPNASPSTNAFQFFNRRGGQQHNRWGFYWGLPQEPASSEENSTAAQSPSEHPANADVSAEDPPDHQECGSRTHEATTADDSRDPAAEHALQRQSSDATTSTDSSVSDSSASVDDTIELCMQCEFEPGTEGPLGLFCRKCALELSESGIQIYRSV